jgi:UDP-glucose 4-epimerase
MTDRRPVLVIGAGGLLGSALMRISGPASEVTPCRGVEWPSDRAPDQLAEVVRNFTERGGQLAIVWSAGAGVIGTSESELRRETQLFATMLDAIAESADVSVLLASSAGGVYAASPDVPITERSEPMPLSEYGHNKLRQEALLRDWVGRRGARGVAARLSTLYGPGQSLGKNQGLLSHLCRSVVTQQPVSIFVSLDTLRDYLFVDDAAHMVVAAVERSFDDPAPSVVTKVIASAQSISIGGVLAEVRRVCPKPPRTVLGTSPNRAAHGSTLNFRSCVWTEIDRRTLTTLPVGIAATYRSIGREIAAPRSSIRHRANLQDSPT